MRKAAVVLAAVTSLFTAACVDPGAGAGGDDVVVTDDVSAPTPDDQKADANDLSTAQARTVRSQLDLICGDTWCDGDYLFSFKKVVCHFTPGTCTVTALVWPVTDVKPVPVYWRSCKISGLHAFADLVDTYPSGYQTIDQGFYDKMTDCTMKIVARLPPAP